VVRATFGTWLSYASTITFQVVFAAHYGTSLTAAAFIVVFGLGLAATGVIMSTVQSVALPRLLDERGAVLTGPLLFLLAMSAVALVAAAAIELSAGWIAGGVAAVSRLPVEALLPLVQVMALVFLLQLLANEASSIALARGRRLLPALTPGLPYLGATAALIAGFGGRSQLIYVAFALGALVQLILLILSVWRGWRLQPGSHPQMGTTALAMFLNYSLLVMVLPLERVLASTHSAADAAQYDYAIRSLKAAQQLIIGGLVLAALGDWSALAVRRGIQQLRESLLSAVVLGSVLLFLAASIGLVAAPALVGLVYQHGRFGAADTAAVSWVVLLALPGFCAEGIALIFASALLSTRHTATLVGITGGGFVLRLAGLLFAATRWGAPGIAVVYSIVLTLTLAAMAVAAVRHGLWPSAGWDTFRKGAVIAALTTGTALFLVLMGQSLPGLLNGAIVSAVFVCAFLLLRPVPALRLLPR
jgi:peptidoglycan biosynthesis protein MviN/MurJ (putative lipid II flippase)